MARDLDECGDESEEMMVQPGSGSTPHASISGPILRAWIKG